jgi:reactive intermediate/imine deaminase
MPGSPRRVAVSSAPPPAGHYSPAVVHGGVIYISGQLGARPDGSHTAGEPFEAQARQALSNLLAVLSAAGGSADNLLKVTAYIVGVENWPAFNAVYAGAMGEARPARSVVPVPELHHGYLVEIEAIAAAPAPPEAA